MEKIEITNDYLLKVIGIKEVSRMFLEEENINIREELKKSKEEKETLQKLLKEKTEDV